MTDIPANNGIRESYRSFVRKKLVRGGNKDPTEQEVEQELNRLLSEAAKRSGLGTENKPAEV